MALHLHGRRGRAQLRHLVGIENILWSTDFPHPATTWPNSREVVDRQFADIPDEERELICAGTPHGSTAFRLPAPP